MHDQARDDARETIVIAAGRHGIEMRSHQHRGRVDRRARQRRIDISGGVLRDVQSDVIGRMLDQRRRDLSCSLQAGRVTPSPSRVRSAERVEQLFRQWHPRVDGGGKITQHGIGFHLSPGSASRSRVPKMTISGLVPL